MPNNNPELAWNEENMSQVLSDLYRDAANDETLHSRLLVDPYGVLSERIALPDEYRGGVFSRVKNEKTLMLYVPAFGAAPAAMSAGTSAIQPKADYEIICSTTPLW